MTTFLDKIRKIEFEIRIFISLGIVIVICLISFLAYPDVPSNMERLGSKVGLSQSASLKWGYGFVAFIMVVASMLRMWAGSVLSSPRVMSFKIRKELLAEEGPYKLTRNPIYLADLLCFVGFALCLPPIGIALPVLLFLHYIQLIVYEEKNLNVQFGNAFAAYQKRTPRFIPGIRSIGRLRSALRDFYINKDGFRHNAQYVLLVPGFIVTAFTGNLLHAIAIGFLGVLDWAIVHTKIGLHPQKGSKPKDAPSPLTDEKIFKDILYAQCWEDPQIDRKAFNIGPDDVVFSITSGGCNTLAFLIDNPQKVYALDLSPYQNYLLDLKMAAFRALNYQEVLEFTGVLPSAQRMAYYRRTAALLKPESREYWDDREEKITAGIIHCGRYEWYMRWLRQILNLLAGKQLTEALYACSTPEERRQLYERRWNNLRWKLFTKIFLSRTVMSLLFTKAFFEQLEDSFSFGDHFRERIKRALVDLPLKENYFLAYILLGRYYSTDHLPVYLQKEHFERIKKGIHKIELVTGSCEELFDRLPDGSISKFNFSNIFEWMGPAAFQQLLTKTARVAREGSVLTYRNLLVPRSRPAALSAWIRPQDELASQLLEQDRSFIYRAYRVEQITKSHGIPN